MIEALLAPELDGLTAWVQSQPQRLENLRGQVVGIEFWTHGCSYCVHAAPRLQAMYDTYGKQGFVLIGIHTPEFDEEKDAVAVKKFLLHTHLTYPVALDHDRKVWDAYGTQYWPTLYLIDKTGHIRSTHIGDGGYEKIKQDLEQLLSEPYAQQ